MTIQTFTFNPFATNCYLCHDAGEAVLIDPSSVDAAEHNQVLAYIEAHNLTVKHLLLTHAHIDHIFGCAFMANHFGQSFHLHPDERPFIEHAQQQARMFGIALEQPPMPAHTLHAGDTFSIGSATWEVLHTPGHSPGSVTFYDAVNRFIISGDVLFQGSIGRTDLWQGSLPTLMASIYQQLVPLGDDVRVYAGHGPATTIGQERQTNPFLDTP